jgi:hypothetical protein
MTLIRPMVYATALWAVGQALGAARPIASVNLLDRSVERIADAALRNDVGGLGRTRLDLAPQARDLSIDHPIVHLIVIQPTRFEQLIARHDTLR